ncbi:unnamed protein product [Lota lota]
METGTGSLTMAMGWTALQREPAFPLDGAPVYPRHNVARRDEVNGNAAGVSVYIVNSWHPMGAVPASSPMSGGYSVLFHVAAPRRGRVGTGCP